ncbi:MAG: DDE-type integrase/transposase/recombinase, partial [Dactylosporangium sp.]|nr:DDE-type integrase/transposase/recombinase [Dactylosporangium sp.]
MGGSAPASTPPLAELPPARREEALRRWRILRPHLEDGVALPAAVSGTGVPLRTAERWLARFRASGLAGLARAPRADRGARKIPDELRLLVEGLSLRTPRPSVAHVHRQVVPVAAEHGWPVPSYDTVYAIVRQIDPGLVTLAVEGAKRYQKVFDLIYRREAADPNAIWQADHTELDLWVVTPSGKPARPWLTIIEDDYSRVVAGYAVNLGAPSAIQTALVLRQAIWRKSEPGWHVCGIPAAFYTGHGSDFTSQHMEQVAADLKIRLIFSGKGRPRGRGESGVVLRNDQPDVPAHAARLRPARDQGPGRAGPTQPHRTRRGDRPVHRRRVQPAAAQRNRPAAPGPVGGQRLPAAAARQPRTPRSAAAHHRQATQGPPRRHPPVRPALPGHHRARRLCRR